MRCVARFFRDEEAATAVEYSVMLALILMTVLSSITILGIQVGDLWGDISNSITKAQK